MKLIIDIDNEEYKGLVTEGHIFVKHIFDAVKNGTPIPNNATNGNMIKAMFSHYDIEIDEHKGYVRVFYEDFYTTYPMRWWNAPYQKGGKE